MTSQIPALVFCYFLPTTCCPAQKQTPPAPSLGSVHANLGAAGAGRRRRRSATRARFVTACTRRALCRHEPWPSVGALRFRAAESLEDKVEAFAFPFATEGKKKQKPKTPSLHFTACGEPLFQHRQRGGSGEGGWGEEKGTNLQLALQSGMQRMHKQPRSALLAAPSPALLALKLAPGSWEQSSEGKRASQ